MRNGDVSCKNCGWFKPDFDDPTWERDFYLAGRSVQGYCVLHRADLFVMNPCAAWIPNPINHQEDDASC